MSDRIKQKGKRSSIRMTHVLAVFLLVFACPGAYLYSLFVVRSQKPSRNINVYINELRAYYGVANQFPKDLVELAEVMPQRRSSIPVALSEANRSFVYRNYYYLYTQSGTQACTLWAVPLGEYRNEAPTLFLVITRDGLVPWKGRALTSEQFQQIYGLMRDADLIRLGMVREPAVVLPAPHPQQRSPRRSTTRN